MPVWLQRYLELPPSEDGEGTAWRILWESPWPTWIPDWLGWFGCLAIIACLIWVIRRDARHLPSRARWTLMVLRVSVLAILLVLVGRPVLSVNRTIDPLVVILIDTSESMSLKDQYQSPEIQKAVAELLNATGDNIPTRLNLSKGLLLADEAQFLKTILESHKLRVYRFSDAAIALHAGEITSAQELPELIKTIESLETSGQETKPGAAIEQVLAELKATPPSSLIVVSDGIATGSDGTGRLSEAVPDLKKQRVSAWTVGIGSKEAAKDLRLADVRVPEIAFLDDLISFECLVGQVGFAGEASELSVELRENQETLVSETVLLSSEEELTTVSLDWQPDLTGEIEFLIQIAPLDDEIDRDNNRLIRKILIRDQPLKVLLAEDRPRYEYRYLKHFLEREPSVDVDSVLLAGDLQQSLQDPSGQKLAGRFPVRNDQILNYDVIILGDLGPQDLGPGVVNLLREAVEVEGVSLILMGGPRKNPSAWKGSALESLFPVELETRPFAPPLRWQERGFQPRPTVAGLQTTPAFRWGEDRSVESSYWDELTPWYRLVVYPELKSGAVTWLTTEPLGQGRPGLPLLVEQRFGAGKVLFQATDELWRLRFLTQDKFYGRYWLQTLRYLTRSSGSDQRGELSTDRRKYQRGEPVVIRLKSSLVTEGSAPQVSLTGPEAFETTLQSSDLHPELYTTELQGLPEGNYQVVWKGGDAETTLTADFRIELAQQELKDRNMNQDGLSQLAEQSGGRYAELVAARKFPELIPPGQKILLEALAPQPLWNRWELLVLLFSLLTVEWILRKRFQLI
ncbi:MAG: VWA domain-containing protein [Planctomycetaceae bacterium]|nr:VWA domain-containing protein [Planctomycetaceae bacterium]